MHILHGTWWPGDGAQFENEGCFLFWVESDTPLRGRRKSAVHPHHLSQPALRGFFTEVLPLAKPLLTPLKVSQAPTWLILPSGDKTPLPSLEKAYYQGIELPESFTWQPWQVDTLEVVNPLPLLKEIHFQVQHYPDRVVLGNDLLFWYRYGCAFRELINRHEYIPALLPRSPKTPSGRRQKRVSTFSFEPTWRILSPRYGDLLNTYAATMPMVCRAASRGPNQGKAKPKLYDSQDLLRHFSEQTLNKLVSETPFTQKIYKEVAGTFIGSSFGQREGHASMETWKQWCDWRRRLESLHEEGGFILGFRLHEALPKRPDDWYLEWLVTSRQDPSLQLSLKEYWELKGNQRATFQRRFGKGFEQRLLLQLAHGARMYPQLWEGLKTDRPVGIPLNRPQALDFLKESAWVLEDGGYKVIVPAWWTPEGRQRARLRLRTSAPTSSQGAAGGYFNLPSLLQYRYELAIGDQPVSEQEWQLLVESKASLVHFRGQWIELDQDKMARMLEFWQKQPATPQEMSLTEVLQRAAASEEDEEMELVCDEALAEMLSRLRNKESFIPLETPPGLQGELRGYQQRGLSWLRYLEHLGLGPCLADDMGLGKTIQVIALLLQERSEAQAVGPTLLIAPTSVLGNWQKELERFAPQLKVAIHHGSQRRQESKAFQAACREQDVVITSFTLARKDAKLLAALPWRRLVVDEAQNIKNPNAAQTKAVLKLEAQHRIALTGTPIENRLLDLWSIFRFLNPGYLGTATQFRKRFEIPIRKEEDAACSATLKRLVEPFILRRMKTDKTIIAELPDKLEQKIYCNLSQEQASLYEAVIQEIKDSLAETEGIQRKGLILSTLMRLKQICNHPAQFLQDGSEFSEGRSHKLERVAQMVEEVMAEGESLLLFTQFTEIGQALEKRFQHHYHYPTYYLHGGTARRRRERMIAEFQDPDTGPAVFILSLKAGGVGINLTRANHVFHFDRWWNPAVENQATDRAYRIGQTKQVFVHKMVTLGTLEERIDQMLEEKQRLAGSIVGTDESWLTELDNEAFQALIELNRSAVLE